MQCFEQSGRHIDLFGSRRVFLTLAWTRQRCRVKAHLHGWMTSQPVLDDRRVGQIQRFDRHLVVVRSKGLPHGVGKRGTVAVQRVDVIIDVQGGRQELLQNVLPQETRRPRQQDALGSGGGGGALVWIRHGL